MSGGGGKAHEPGPARDAAHVPGPARDAAHVPGPARDAARAAFLAEAGWADAQAEPVAGDASTRSYVRLHRAGRTAILMDAPPGPDGPPVAAGLSYSALVHLAETMRPFAALARHLRTCGLSAPEVIAQDLGRGFLLLEDLGDAVFGPEIDAGRLDETQAYGAAVDVLAHLHGAPAPGPLDCGDGGPAYTVPAFDERAMLTEAGLLLAWYPRLGHVPPPDDAAHDAFFAAWRTVLASLAEPAAGEAPRLVLRDYHSPNLLWLPGRAGIAQVGVIDFQDALAGPAAYDVVSLLQDARRTVAPDIEARLLARYMAARARDEAGFDPHAFRAAYAVMGAQRNTKIIGIFARLCLRDGKPRYLAHIPRLAAYLARDLAHPALAPVADWHARHMPLEVLARPVPPPGDRAAGQT